MTRASASATPPGALDTLITVGVWALTLAIAGGVAFGYGFLRGWWS